MDDEKRRRWFDAFTVRTVAAMIALLATIFLTRNRWEAWVVEQELPAVSSSSVFTVDFSPLTERLFIQHNDGQKTLIDAHSGDVLARFAGGEHSWVHEPFSRDGQRVVVRGRTVDPLSAQHAASATGTERSGRRIVDSLTGRVVFSLPRETTLFRLSPDGRRVIAASEGIGVRLWDTDTGKPLAPLSTLSGLDHWVADAGFSADSRYVAVRPMGAPSDILAVWDATTGERVSVLSGADWALDIRFSPSDRFVFTRCDERQACYMWDWRTGERVAQIECPKGARHEVSRDGSLCVVNFPRPKGTEVWCLDTARRLCCIRGPVEEFISISAVARRLVTRDGPDVVAYDLETGSRELRIPWPYGPGEGWNLPRITPDGARVIVAGTMGRAAHVWDIQTGELLALLPLGFHFDVIGNDRVFDPGHDVHLIYRRIRPEQWWGVFCLWHFWLIVLLSLAFAWSIWRGVKSLRQR